MSLNDVVSAERIHIGFFGLRNAGKSSVVNAVTGQKLSLVSDIKGTTTDPVQKAMEILPLGPVVIIDTPGIDDEGMLGEMRVKRAKQVLSKVDIAVLVIDGQKGMQPADEQLIQLFKERNIPYIKAFNKSDLLEKKECLQPAAKGGEEISNHCSLENNISPEKQNEIFVSAETGENIYELKELIGNLAKKSEKERHLAKDLMKKGDIVVLVTPIDESAPKGRMILPQQQMIREVLDNDAINIVVQVGELKGALEALNKKPAIVITDSQAFEEVAKIVPEDIPLTSFSILFARYKGELEEPVRGAFAIDSLKDGDKILISEGCTHHRQCNDIGTVKLPHWLEDYTGKKFEYEFTSGGEFAEDPKKYAMVIHCGACMLNEREVKSRIARCRAAYVPITNYGIAIAHMHGILKRATKMFDI